MEKELKKKQFIILIFFVVFLFIYTFNVTSSRYLEQVKVEANDVIAIPVISLSNPTFEYENDKMLPGFTNEGDLIVSNYDDKNTNELLMSYYFKITKESTIPVKITLTTEDGTELPLNDSRTEEITLPYDEKVQTKYHLKIEWDEQDNSYIYAGKDLKINIDLIATQVTEGA